MEAVSVMSALSPESEIIYPIVVVKLSKIKRRALLDTGVAPMLPAQSCPRQIANR